MKKFCNVCLKEKDLDDFYNIKKWKSKACKNCASIRSSKWKKENKYRTRIHQIKTSFGITENEWKKMYEEQNYRCAICYKTEEENGKLFSVDHDHKTGKVRGLLCSECNQGLGKFKDQIAFLKRAIRYLRKNIKPGDQ